MQRTLNQNSFYHSIIADIHKQAMALHITVENKEYLRNGLKENDDSYPTEYIPAYCKDKPMSSARLSTKQMVSHIEFIIEFMGRFGITPNFVELDYERMMKLAHKQGI